MTAPLRVETERLVLAPPAAADAAAIFERYASDAEVTRYVGWPRHRSLADTESFLAFSAGQWARAGRDPGWTRQVEFPNLAPGVAQDVRCYALPL